METGTKVTTKEFAKLLETQQKERLVKTGLGCVSNLENAKVSIREGKKYIKIDVGTSGKFMIEKTTENIYGIKAYGVIHRGHHYGSLQTINQYYWGDYSPIKREAV